MFTTKGTKGTTEQMFFRNIGKDIALIVMGSHEVHFLRGAMILKNNLMAFIF